MCGADYSVLGSSRASFEFAERLNHHLCHRRTRTRWINFWISSFLAYLLVEVLLWTKKGFNAPNHLSKRVDWRRLKRGYISDLIEENPWICAFRSSWMRFDCILIVKRAWRGDRAFSGGARVHSSDFWWRWRYRSGFKKKNQRFLVRKRSENRWFVPVDRALLKVEAFYYFLGTDASLVTKYYRNRKAGLLQRALNSKPTTSLKRKSTPKTEPAIIWGKCAFAFY